MRPHGHQRMPIAEPSDGLPPPELVRLRRGLLIMALQRLGDGEAAEEAAQESIARVLAAVNEGRIDDRSKLGGFARSVAHHVIVDMIRRRERHRPLEAHEEVRSLVPDPLSRLVSEEEQRRVRGALDTLTPKDRNVLRLTFFDGLEPMDVARRLGEPPERIRKRKQRAVERLRAAFLDMASHAGPTSATMDQQRVALPARAGGVE